MKNRTGTLFLFATGWFLTLCALQLFSPAKGPLPESSRPLFLAISFFFCFPSLLAMLAGEVVLGWGVTVFSVLTLSFFSLKHLSLLLLWPAPLLIGVTSLSHVAVRALREKSKESEISLERLEREGNLLNAQAQEETLQYPALKRKLERYASLSQVTHLLSSSLVVKEVTQCAAQQAYEVIGKSAGSFLLVLEEGGEELLLASSFLAKDFSGPKLKKGDLFDQWVLKNRRPLLVRNSREDFRFNLDQLEKREVASLMITPLTTGQRITGLLRVESLEKDIYTSDDLRLLSIIGDLVAASLENAHLAQRTEELARVDELTGLYVHRYFQERLQEEFSRSQRNRAPLSLLMIDIDHFKTYNDRYGHIAGDLVLKQVAHLLKEKSKAGDLVCRYGGEEFSIILPNRAKGEALSLAEELRFCVEKEAFTLRRETTHVTISIGVASFPADGLVKDELLKRVDSFLYQAKREGRNRVCGS